MFSRANRVARRGKTSLATNFGSWVEPAGFASLARRVLHVPNWQLVADCVPT